MNTDKMVTCAGCEGWGCTSYDDKGVPNLCEHCRGIGKVVPVEITPVVYGLTACQAAIKEVRDLAYETSNSNNAEARELAEKVVKLFEDFYLIEDDSYVDD